MTTVVVGNALERETAAGCPNDAVIDVGAVGGAENSGGLVAASREAGVGSAVVDLVC